MKKHRDGDAARLPAAAAHQSILGNLLEGCQIISPDWRYVYVNNAVARHGRRTREELIGRTMMEVYPGIETTPMFAALGRCMHDRIPRRMENEFVFPDGTCGWFDIRFEPVPEGVFILSLEITARKRAEESLRRLNRRLRIRSETSRALVHAPGEEELMNKVCRLLLDAGGYCGAWVGFAREGAGASASLRPAAHAGFELGACDLLVLADCPPEDRNRTPAGAPSPAAAPRVSQDVMTDPACAGWRELARARGCASMAAFPLVAGGRTLGALSIYAEKPNAFDEEEVKLLTALADDLAFGVAALRGRADREHALAALRESEARYKALFEGAVEGILVADVATRRFVYANPAMCRMLGYTEEQLTRMGVADIHPAESLPGVIREFEALAQGAKTVAQTIPCRRSDGAVIFADMNSATVLIEGRRCNVGFFADVTRRKELEEQFHQAQKLEAIGRLAGGIAHDFNNILMVQTGYCDLLAARLESGDPVAEGLSHIRACAELAASLTRQLLAFSRKQPFQPAVLDLNAVVAHIEPMLRRLIGEDVALVTALAPGLGRVEADPGQIDQVIMNLAVNARDAMPRGGTLTIATGNVLAGTAAAPSAPAGAAAAPHVLLSISDTGCGMDEATKGKLFEPFFTTKEPGKGTGLGLATVYGIVTQSRGSIKVDSEPGKGATFTIFLPRVSTEVRPARPPALAGAGGGAGELVLLVEDEPTLRELMSRMVARLGYRVKTAAGGSEALNTIEAEGLAPDLLITDMIMPGMGGQELAQRLARVHPAVKVLFTSGYPGDRQVLGAGAAFLQKPFGMAALAAKMRELLGARAP